MNRRDFVPRSAATVAGLMLAGKVLGQDNKCTAPCNPGRLWKETGLTKKLQSEIGPQVEKVKASKNLNALSIEEWFSLYTQHRAWGDEHSRIGNLHLVDLYLQANQVELRKKAGNKPVDRMLELGCHQCWTQDAKVFAEISKSLSHVKWSSDDCRGLTVYGADAAILGMMFAGMGLEPLGVLFGAIDVVIYFTAIAYCT